MAGSATYQDVGFRDSLSYGVELVSSPPSASNPVSACGWLQSTFRAGITGAGDLFSMVVGAPRLANSLDLHTLSTLKQGV